MIEKLLGLRLANPRAGGSGARGDARLLPPPGEALAADSLTQSAHSVRQVLTVLKFPS
jgi:hypothetical protein